MRTRKLLVTLLVAGFSLTAVGGTMGCSKSPAAASAPLTDATTSLAPQEVPIDVGAYGSRVQTTLTSLQGGTAALALTDGSTIQVPGGLLPAGATVGNIYILSMALTSAEPAAAQISQYNPNGSAEIVAPQGNLSLPAAIMPTQSNQQGYLVLQIYANPKPAQAISFNATVTNVSATTLALRGTDGAGSFQLPRALDKYPTLATGDQYLITLTSTNEPADDWSGTVTSVKQGSLSLSLTATGTQVQYPSVYAPPSVQPGDFFSLTLVKVTYQSGDLLPSS